MGLYGSTKTWKITYNPKVLNGGVMGVAFVEANTKLWAMHSFQQLYTGQFLTIENFEELLSNEIVEVKLWNLRKKKKLTYDWRSACWKVIKFENLGLVKIQKVS